MSEAVGRIGRSIMSQSILCNYFKVCTKFTLEERERERGRGGDRQTDRQTDRQRNEGRSRGVVKRNIQYISPDSETRSGFNCFLEPAVLSACRKFSGDFFLSF